MCTKTHFLLFITLVAASVPLRAQSDPSLVSRLGQDRDYLFPESAPPAPRALRSVPSVIGQGDQVTYSSFTGRVYTLTEFRGKNVSFLLPESWVTGLTKAERTTLLDRSDLLYEHLKDLVGGEPAGAGLLRVALIPETCGWGCAWIGAKGVEVMDADWSLAIAKSILDAGQVPSVFSHEMTHNFDLYWPYMHYLREHAHAWTAFMDSYIQIYSQQGYVDYSPADLQTYKVWEQWDAYLQNRAATWQNSVRDGDPNIEFTHLIWGGMHQHFALLHGAGAVRRFLQFYHDYALLNPAPSTPEEKEDLDVEALAAGAGSNLSCYADVWKWPASPDLRARMANAYGESNSRCIDQDGDGFSAAAGDLDETNPDVHPVSEWTGSDFPGSSQDAFQAVPVSLPSLITGSGNLGDVDSFEFLLQQPTKVRFSVRSFDPFQGWFSIYNPTRDAHSADIFIPVTSVTTHVEQYGGDLLTPRAVSLASSSAIPGRYSIGIFAASPWPLNWGTLSTARSIEGGGFQLQLDTQVVPDQLPTEVRFWVSGIGFVGAVPYSPSVTFDWHPDSALPSGEYGYRAQLFRDNIPVSSDTELSLFTIAFDTTGPVITPHVNGVLGANGWYTSDVQLQWDVVDPESGISSSSQCGTTVLSSDTSSTTLSCTATNGTGITTSASVTVKIDKTEPAILGMPTPGCSIWPPNHKMVEVAHVTAADTTSGIAPNSLRVDVFSNGLLDRDGQVASVTPDGSGGFIVQLRSERDGNKKRVYIITAATEDFAGNRASMKSSCRVEQNGK